MQLEEESGVQAAELARRLEETAAALAAAREQHAAALDAALTEHEAQVGGVWLTIMCLGKVEQE